jgi:hypothetical protein
VLGIECWVLGSGYCCWGLWVLCSDAQKRHDIGKTGCESLLSPCGAVDSHKNKDECGGGIDVFAMTTADYLWKATDYLQKETKQGQTKLTTSEP